MVEVLEERKVSIYGWAFKIGRILLECLEARHGVDGAKKRMKTIILTLRSELIPHRFRKALINTIIEIATDCKKSVGIRSEIKEETRWSVDEFYRYSTAILSGLYDAWSSYSAEEEKQKEEEEHA